MTNTDTMVDTKVTSDTITESEYDTLANGVAMLVAGITLAAGGLGPVKLAEAERELIVSFIDGLSNNGFELRRIPLADLDES